MGRVSLGGGALGAGQVDARGGGGVWGWGVLFHIL